MTLQQKPPLHPNPPPLIRVSGTHREIGRQIGEACTPQVLHGLENARQLFEDSYEQLELTWEGAKIQARKYMPFAQERYPQYIEEIMGIAEGAKVHFDDLAVLNAMEAVTSDALHLTRCTSMAVNEERTADGHVLAAHNEDWMPEDEGDVFIIHVTPKSEPPFLAMTYGGLLPNIGINAYGIAQLCDSVYPSDSRIGIPRTVNSRAVLAAKTPSEAINHMLAPRRAAGYNHLLVHESGEMYNVEVSARRFAILYGEDGYLAHTNNYLAENMTVIEDEPEELVSSRVRYFRAMGLLKRIPQHTLKSLQAIQRDHVNFPNSICNHSIDDQNPLDREKTINAMVIDLTVREIHIAWGNPCENPYHTYHLDA
ncbi:MAG: C45 family peptidase [Anaerolineales bacterium]|nr:C45 family peptidase [Anaerolineales bacterium]MDO9349181.1 C45 family peptidase [Anaerolineales bacterium]